jgi:hypothetical protein
MVHIYIWNFFLDAILEDGTRHCFFFSHALILQEKPDACGQLYTVHISLSQTIINTRPYTAHVEDDGSLEVGVWAEGEAGGQSTGGGEARPAHGRGGLSRNTHISKEFRSILILFSKVYVRYDLHLKLTLNQ